MNVIKEGVFERHKLPKIQVTCSQCNSVLEIDRADLQGNKIAVGNPSLRYVECPICTNIIFLNQSQRKELGDDQ